MRAVIEYILSSAVNIRPPACIKIARIGSERNRKQTQTSVLELYD